MPRPDPLSEAVHRRRGPGSSYEVVEEPDKIPPMTRVGMSTCDRPSIEC